MNSRLGQWTFALGICVAAPAIGIGRPPELPTSPETEFRVLSTQAQEYFQPDAKNTAGVFVPLTESDPAEAATDMTKHAESVVETLTVMPRAVAVLTIPERLSRMPQIVKP